MPDEALVSAASPPSFRRSARTAGNFMRRRIPQKTQDLIFVPLSFYLRICSATRFAYDGPII